MFGCKYAGILRDLARRLGADVFYCDSYQPYGTSCNDEPESCGIYKRQEDKKSGKCLDKVCSGK